MSRQGVVIVKKPDGITLSNPGDFRIEVDAAKSGGVSDPRNVTLMKTFNLVDVGERAGSGIPSIFYVWKQQGWRRPSIAQTAEPDRVTVSLPVVITSGDNKAKAAMKSGDNEEKAAIKSGDNVERLKLAAQKEIIVAYLTDHVQAKSGEIGALLGLKPSRVRVILKQMADEGLIETAGANRNRVYRLRS